LIYVFDHGLKITKKINENEDTPIHILAKYGNFECFERILGRMQGEEKDILNKNNDTPLMVAIENNNSKVASVLIDLGANLNKENLSQETPLIIACRKGLIDICRKLLDNGADQNFKNILGDTPLSTANKYHQEEIALLLLNEFKASIRPPSSNLKEIASKTTKGKIINKIK